MKPWINELVELHARHRPGELTTQRLSGITTPSGRTLAQLEADKDALYLAVSVSIQESRAFLEAPQVQQASSTEARRACLRRLRDRTAYRTGDVHPGQILDLLIQRLMLPAWPAEDVRVYQRVAEMILEWRHYFLSYTRRGGPDFNQAFKDLWRARFRRPSDEQLNENLVANLVDHHLRTENLEGHIDYKALRDGDLLDPTIKDQLRQSFVLVQLMQKAALTVPQVGQTNWCYDEFKHFTDPAGCAGGERLSILVAGDTLAAVTPAVIPVPYVNDWLSKIDETKWSPLPKRPKALDAWVGERARAIADRKRELINAAIDV